MLPVCWHSTWLQNLIGPPCRPFSLPFSPSERVRPRSHDQSGQVLPRLLSDVPEMRPNSVTQSWAWESIWEQTEFPPTKLEKSQRGYLLYWGTWLKTRDEKLHLNKKKTYSIIATWWLSFSKTLKTEYSRLDTCIFNKYWWNVLYRMLYFHLLTWKY